jgi:predicted transport protein
MKHIKLIPISLKSHPVLDERWVHEVIAADSTILGLGDVIVKDRERVQASGGRLDLLLQEAETKSRYEVEIQLGQTDPSHIIRTIEYWDIERKRYPQYEHTAVIIAEEITSRFLNVIGLFNGSIPIIAIQMKAVATEGGVSLFFTKVLDTIQRGLVDEDEEVNEPADRAYWESRGSAKTVKLADQVLEMCKGFTSDLELSYNKHYIGFRVDGKACNFATCRPRKSAMWVAIALPKSEEVDALLAASDLDLMEYSPRDGRYRFRLGLGDVSKHAEILKNLLKQGYDRRNAQ